MDQSQVYILKRKGKQYQAPSFEILREWIKQGRVKIDDEVLVPNQTQWMTIQDHEPLRVLFSDKDHLLIKRGDQVYKAPNLALIQEWARLGKVSPKDYIYFPKFKKWLSVALAPSLMSLIPQTIKDSFSDNPQSPRGATS